jgi:hypothetical protein
MLGEGHKKGLILGLPIPGASEVELDGAENWAFDPQRAGNRMGGRQVRIAGGRLVLGG